jgi:hypothetical protein
MLICANASLLRLLRLLILAGLVSGIACSTVELGDPPADVNACRPSQTFFVDRVWPEFLASTHAGKTCGDSNCHDPASGRLLRVVNLASTPSPAIPLAGGSDWDIAYRSAAQQMNCTNVRASELFTRPAGLRTHGGGALIDPINGPEGPLLDMWVAASP